MKTRYLSLALPAIPLLLAGCNINKNITVPAHAHWSSGSSTINGEISVGTGAVVDGSLRTINGRINVATGAQTGNLTGINGNITLAEGVHAGDLKAVNGGLVLGKDTLTVNLATVNGDIHAATGAHIGGTVRDVNGGIVLCGAQVDGDLSFYNGTALLTDGTVMQGNVTATKPNGTAPSSHEPRLIVGPHTTVTGTIIFERPGKLYVSDNAVIHGVTGVTAVKFSGVAPAGVHMPTCPPN
ncbi:MAG: hypothetical protein ACYDB9_02705 [Gammaproteobacteria bacterium]